MISAYSDAFGILKNIFLPFLYFPMYPILWSWFKCMLSTLLDLPVSRETSDVVASFNRIMTNIVSLIASGSLKRDRLIGDGARSFAFIRNPVVSIFWEKLSNSLIRRLIFSSMRCSLFDKSSFNRLFAPSTIRLYC